ncbi:MAG TPA: hypothetical protein V6D20_24775 [Candidatus Obscuribacterales bacterium]
MLESVENDLVEAAMLKLKEIGEDHLKHARKGSSICEAMLLVWVRAENLCWTKVLKLWGGLDILSNSSIHFTYESINFWPTSLRGVFLVHSAIENEARGSTEERRLMKLGVVGNAEVLRRVGPGTAVQHCLASFSPLSMGQTNSTKS